MHGGGCHSAVGTLSTSTAGSRCPRTALPELPPTATRARLPAAGGCRRLPPPACPLLDRGGARTQPGDGATACNSWCCSACGLSDMPCTGRVQCCCYRHASAAPAGHPVMGARRARPIPLLPPRPLRTPPTKFLKMSSCSCHSLCPLLACCRVLPVCRPLWLCCCCRCFFLGLSARLDACRGARAWPPWAWLPPRSQSGRLIPSLAARAEAILR